MTSNKSRYVDKRIRPQTHPHTHGLESGNVSQISLHCGVGGVSEQLWGLNLKYEQLKQGVEAGLQTGLKDLRGCAENAVAI